MNTEDGAYAELLLENEELRTALSNLVVNVLEDVPAESMTEHLITAISEAEDLLADLGDIDHKETEECG